LTETGENGARGAHAVRRVNRENNQENENAIRRLHSMVGKNVKGTQANIKPAMKMCHAQVSKEFLQILIVALNSCISENCMAPFSVDNIVISTA